MKKSLALIISLAFFGSSISMPAFAAVKAGSSCKKAGVTTVASGKKFTCVKSGKKFVWNKGVTIQIPGVPAPSSEPSPSASAEPASAYPKSPTSFDDLVENYKGISYGAWSKSQAKIKSSEKTDFTYKLVLGPNSTLTNKEPTVAFHLVTRLYSGYAKPGDVYFLAFNFEDRDWAAKQMNSIMPNAVSQWIYDVACPSKEMCDGGGAYFDGSNKYLVVETVGLINENTTSGTLEAHEFTHTIQQKTMGSPRPPVEFLTSPWLPNWYWEGQARFAQDAAIWSNSFETYLRVRNATSGGLIQSTQYNSKYIEEYFVLNPNKEWGAKHARQRQYDLGARLIEVLTAIKGPDSTMEMWKLAGSGSSLEAAFEKVYGTPFKTALPIISKAIALDLGRNYGTTDKSNLDKYPFQMKRKLAFLVVISILCSSLSIPAVAAVKAGASCPKAGKTSVASGKTFTCVKSGKKLVWNKGVAVAKPAVAPTPTPSATSEPIAAKIPAMPTSFADLEEKYQGIPYAVWEKIQSNLAIHKSTDLKINFQFGPNTPQRYPNQWTIDAVTLGSRVMGAQKQPAEAKFVQFNKADLPWARTEAEKYVSPFKLGNSFPDQASGKCEGVDCDGAVTNIANEIALVLVGVATPVTHFNIQKFNGQNDLHEYTHAVQGMVFKGKTQSPPPVLMPCWYSEGQPQAVSIPTVAKSAEDYVKIRKSWITDNRWLLKDYEPETIQEFLRNNMKLPCDGSSYAMVFSLGYIVMDALVAVGGIDKTFDVLTARADGLSFEESFKKVYGVTWDEASIALSRAASKVYKENKK